VDKWFPEMCLGMAETEKSEGEYYESDCTQ